jgi:uncharacterized protein YgiM (DUF1202 family)
MSSTEKTKPPKKRNWVPYLLILPSLIYLALFFAWPMARGLVLAVWNDEALLKVHVEAQQGSALVGHIPQGTQIELLDQQGNFVPEEELEQGNLLTETWFKVNGQDTEGNLIEGWAPETRIRVREQAEDGTPLVGSVRTKLGSTADPLTSIYAQPNKNSEVIGKLEARVQVTIQETTLLEV